MPTYTGTPVTTTTYTTVAAVKAELGVTDAVDDTRLARIVESVSRMIDDHLGQPAYAQTGIRYFQASSPYLIETDPFTAFTLVERDSVGDWSAWETVTGGVAWPYNADDLLRPYTAIHLTPSASTTYPLHDRGVRITATWGLGATQPALVTEAAILQSALVYQAQNAGGGAIGAPDWTSGPMVMAGLHPLVRRMLDPYRHGRSFGIA